MAILGSALRPCGKLAAEALRVGDGVNMFESRDDLREDRENLARSVLRRREEEGSEERDMGRQLSCCWA